MPARFRRIVPVCTILLLTGCTGVAAPARTITITATPTVSSLRPGDAAPWDLHAVCAAEAEVTTLVMWRDQQREAGRLSNAQASTVNQAVAVEYLELGVTVLPAAVRHDADVLTGAAGSLAHPRIDLSSKPVEAARHDLVRICNAQSLTIGVAAQGG